MQVETWVTIQKLFKTNFFFQVIGLFYFFELWTNLKNLSGGLNLSRGINMVGST